MPKNKDLGNASLYLFIATDGSIQKMDMFPSSPSNEIDELVLGSIQKLKLLPLPKEVTEPPLCVLYECGGNNK